MQWHKTSFTKRFDVKYPIMQAPLLGGTTVEMVAASTDAGALGCLPLGYGVASVGELEEMVGAVRMFCKGKFCVNVAVYDDGGDPEVLQSEAASHAAMRSAGRLPASRRLLQGFRTECGLPGDGCCEAGDARGTPSCVDWGLQADAVLKCKDDISCVSVAFGLPPTWFVKKLQDERVKVIATVTSLEEGRAAENRCVSAVIAVSSDAGGEWPGFLPPEDEGPPATSLFELLPLLSQNLRVPVIAAGGVHSPETLAACLNLGASGVVLGTALLLSYESSWPYKQHVVSLLEAKDPSPAATRTLHTRLYTGRWARVLRNPFVDSLAACPRDALPYWPLQLLAMSDFRALFEEHRAAGGAHAYAEVPLGVNYVWSTQFSVRDIICTLVEGVEASLASRRSNR
ncbi:putative nitronate monooxygenase [Diplonema papillatum]|nr:putative nitronate monooxygenase [Diplonema papillatum]